MMRLGTLVGRPVLLSDDGACDIGAASEGRFADTAEIFEAWPEFRDWAERLSPDWRPFEPEQLGAPIPVPGQVFGVGLNYYSHLHEAGRSLTKSEIIPLTFTKFPSSLVGPGDPILLTGDYVDWEVELVAVIGTLADSVPARDALAHVAGYLVGQDISDRAVQRAGFLSVGKSFASYAPTGPWLVSLEDLPDPQALRMRCWLNDELVQDVSTADMIYGVAELIALLSAVTPLRPGDLIFTGTGAGVGVFRQPPRFLRPGDVLRSKIDGIGELRNTCQERADPPDALGALWRNIPMTQR